MAFEFDPKKSAANKKKHGIDFQEAQALWSDAGLVEVPARVEDEPPRQRGILISVMGNAFLVRETRSRASAGTVPSPARTSEP